MVGVSASAVEKKPVGSVLQLYVLYGHLANEGMYALQCMSVCQHKRKSKIRGFFFPNACP